MMQNAYNLNNRIQSTANIDFKEHIRVISDKTLKEFLGFGRLINDYEYLQEMANNAFHSNPHLQELIRLWDASRKYFDFLSQDSMLGWNYFNKY